MFAEAIPAPARGAISPDDVRLLLPTSGATDVPKAAMLTHRNLVANGLACRAHFEFHRSSRIAFWMGPCARTETAAIAQTLSLAPNIILAPIRGRCPNQRHRLVIARRTMRLVYN